MLHDQQDGVPTPLKSRSYSPHPETAVPVTASPNASTREHEVTCSVCSVLLYTYMCINSKHDCH
ncbi:hypothetical protein EON64_10370 [archaeon]|nr:MAG: hypothetical protein EON64_10370 [archaeon]